MADGGAPLIARDYQVAQKAALFKYFREGGEGHPLVGLPTGTGKAFCIADFATDVVKSTPSARVMMLTHVIELIEQNYEELKNHWPGAPAGIYSDGLDRKEHFYPITFAGIASVANKPGLFGKIDLVIIDEAHLVSPKESTMYQKFIKALMVRNPKLRVIGYTATLFRVGQGMLTEPGGLFTHVVFDCTGLAAFNWFIDQGYLVPLVPRPTVAFQDVSKVGLVMGEFNQKQLSAVANKDDLIRDCVAETIAAAEVDGRKHWLVFATGIEGTVAVANEFIAQGINATYVHSKMPKEVRRERIRAFRAGEYQCMVNNGILTTGFNFKALDLIAVMRATNSPGLWVQILGRGTRPLYAFGFDIQTLEGRIEAIRQSDKHNCLVLDFARNSARLGPINDPRIPKPPGSKQKGDAPIKICDKCGMYNHPSYRFCGRVSKDDPLFTGMEGCGTEFIRELKLTSMAGSDEIIKPTDPVNKQKVVIFDVKHVVYNVHLGLKGLPSLLVTYHCDKKNFTEHVCIEHPDAAGRRAARWWKTRTDSDMPATVSAAMREINSLREPCRIHVWVNKGKYPEILNYEY